MHITGDMYHFIAYQSFFLCKKNKFNFFNIKSSIILMNMLTAAFYEEFMLHQRGIKNYKKKLEISYL